MSYIDWESCEEKPTKSQKIEGRFLLDLRAKINDLEGQLREKSISLEKAEQRLKENQEELSQVKVTLSQQNEKIKNLENELEANELTIQDLENELSCSTKQIKTLGKELNSKLQEHLDLKQKCQSLESKVNLPDKMEYLINRINTIMQHKGFISEKELEDVLEGKNLYEFT